MQAITIFLPSVLPILSFGSAFFAVMLVFSAFVPTDFVWLLRPPCIPQMCSLRHLLHFSSGSLLPVGTPSVALTTPASSLLLPDIFKCEVMKASWASWRVAIRSRLVSPCKNPPSIRLQCSFSSKPLSDNLSQTEVNTVVHCIVLTVHVSMSVSQSNAACSDICTLVIST